MSTGNGKPPERNQVGVTDATDDDMKAALDAASPTPGSPRDAIDKDGADQKPQEQKKMIDDNSGDMSQKLALRKTILRQWRIIANAEFILVILAILFMLIDNEMHLNDPTSHHKSLTLSQVLRCFVSFFTFLLLIAVVLYAWTDIKMTMISNGLHTWREAVTPVDIVYLIIELIVCSIHPIPWSEKVQIRMTNGDFMDAHVDGLLSVIMIFRLYIVVRFLAVNTDMYLDTSLRSLCAVNGIEFNTLFIVKAYLSRFPGTILMCIVIGVVGIESWAMRTCEVYYTQGNYTTIIERNPLHTYPENLWLVAITFLTVGYGDVSPMTVCGRFVAVITGFLGVCATALIIALLTKKIEQTKQEKLVSQYATRARLEKKKKRVAGVVVKNTLKLWAQKQKGNPKPIYTEKLASGLQKNIVRMHDIRQDKLVLEQDASEINGDTAALTELKMLVERTRTDVLRIEETVREALGVDKSAPLPV